MSVNNINWEEIEKQTWSPYFLTEFMLDGHKITVDKGSITDSKQIYTVYIDGKIKGSWNKENFPFIIKVWCKHTNALFSKSVKDKLIKAVGRRQAYKYTDLDQKIEYYWANFSTSKRWINQFKKLEGLEQIETEEV